MIKKSKLKNRMNRLKSNSRMKNSNKRKLKRLNLNKFKFKRLSNRIIKRKHFELQFLVKAMCVG